MSRWTHVTGAFEFIAGPYISKKNKKGEEKVILPFPDEQFILSTPEVLEDKLSYRVYLYSLPKVKPIFEKIIPEIMPHGETGFTYFLNQRKDDFRSSSSDFDHDCEEKIFKQKLKELYKKDPYNKDYYEYNKDRFEVSWVEHCHEFAFTVTEDIRYCSGYRLMASFEKLFSELAKFDILFNRGCIEWIDEYEHDLIFSIKQHGIWDDQITFSIFDKKKNCYISKKTLNYSFETGAFIEKKSDNWDSLMKDVEE